MDIGLLISVGAIVVLLLSSGFFSGSETALTAASRARMHARAKEGDARADAVLRLRDQKEKMIGALLLGNSFVNILASAIATGVLIRVFGETGVVYATVAMTALILIFAEVLPKTLAFHDADRLAMTVTPMIRFLIFILNPLVVLVGKIVEIILRMFGVDLRVVKPGDSIEALRGMIEMHRGPEEETGVQRAMLRSILDLAEVEVSEIMTHRSNVVAIDADAPPQEIVEAVLEGPYTRIPVWKGNPDNIIGVLHTRHLLRAVRDCGADLSKLDIASILVPPWFVPDTTDLFDQLEAFRKRREHFALVVDEYGAIMGVVTLEDILEEIVGNIDDEHDIPMPGVHRVAGGGCLVDGTVTIRDLNRQFEWNLPDEEYATVAGLVLHESRQIPDAGQSFTFHGFRFDVLRRVRNQITLLRVTPQKRKEGRAAA